MALAANFTERIKQSFVAQLLIEGHSVNAAEIIADRLIRIYNNDAAAGQIGGTGAYVWNAKYEAAAGPPGTCPGKIPKPPSVAAPVPAPIPGIARGYCPNCKKQYENCICSFGFPNGK